MVSGKRLLFLLLFFFAICGTCRAQDQGYVPKEEYGKLVNRVAALEQKLVEQDKCIKDQNNCLLDQKKKIAEYEEKFAKYDSSLHREEGKPFFEREGFKLGARGTMIVQGANNANGLDSKKKGRTDGSYSADVTMEKEFKELNSEIFLHFETGQNLGLEDNLALYSNVNRDSDDSDHLRATELWYKQGLFNDKAFLTFGKLDPTVYFDNNAAANDETTQFLGRIFRNNPAIEFPDNTAGIVLSVAPVDAVELSYGAFDGNSDWERIGDNLFNIGQANFKPNFFNLEGNYRFFGWSSNVYHTKWLDAEKTKEPAYGFGLSFDQKANDIVTVFTRYAWQSPKVYNPDITATGDLNYSLTHSWSAGFQVEGKSWKRENDVLGFAVGQAIPSKDYKKAGETLDPVRRAKPEGHLEAYYRMFINEHLSLSPDLQYIWNPFGKDISDDTKGIFVGGMRAQVDF